MVSLSIATTRYLFEIREESLDLIQTAPALFILRADRTKPNKGKIEELHLKVYPFTLIYCVLHRQ